jgi:LysM repeat protein
MKIYYTNPNLKYSSGKSRSVATSFSSKIHSSSFSNTFFNWVESNNSFYFQLIGIFILTVGMILSLQNFLDGTKLNASAKESTDIRILTNFQQQNSGSSAGKSSLKEVTDIVPTVELAKPITEIPNIVEYSVKDNETLQSVAAKFKVSVDEITTLNSLLPGQTLTTGVKLKLPFK